MQALAQKLVDGAKDLNSVATDEYPTGINAILDSWSGENAELFCNKATEVQQSMGTSISNMVSAAQTLMTIAKNYAEAELKAIGIAMS